ncbi:hypothetical protein ES708_02517 [subsurface metagenome]
MTRNRLMIGVAVLVLLGAIAVFAFGLPPETTGVGQERAVEETIAVSDQPAGEPNVGLARPAEEANAFSITGYVTVDAYHYDAATGTYVLFYHDEGSNVITVIGIDFIAKQLSGAASATDVAKWISLSNDGGSSAAWTELPIEINASGMTRAVGLYDHTLGTNTYTVAATFTATGAVTVQTTGLQWLVTPVSDGNLMAAMDFTSVVLAEFDTLTITWTITIG